MNKFFIIVTGAVVGFALVFLVTAGVYWLIAWSFDLAFSWKYSVGIAIIWMVLVQLFRRVSR